MQDFTYQNPTRVHFGAGQIAKVRDEIPADARVLVTYGGGSIKRNGVMDQIESALEGREWWSFGGIEPNPSYHTLLEALDVIKREKIDFLLAVGGGSVADGSKFLALAACHAGDPWEILAEGKHPQTALPLGVVLTLPATGSESNGNAVVTNYETHDKLPMFSELAYPRFAVLDPATTLTLPERQSVNGVVDAFIHVSEQYLTYPVNAPVQDRFSEGLLMTLIEEGPKVLSQPDDLAVRANIMWAANLGLNGLIGRGVPQDWATHMIGHEITALHGVDHGRTLTIVMPALWEELFEAKRAKLAQYGRRVWALEGDDESVARDAIVKTREFFTRMGAPVSLSEAGISADSIDKLVENLTRHGFTAIGEHGDITPDVARRILTRAA
ncbi:iron-containing alcohol dehydrogenase [Cobetia crustatorum]|uniref:Iron-containing alcohol dehydrogenase n=1 Tax=Cobetia crustatorum TaxID=553385 RepID=A0A558HN78_9GAMM|nr:iron-containing alcohol dehydrogenase [Cobetia crustatorum]TVU70592.1 iron-containing alcohol dehydrogenase [Cobetia crustatorum]